MTELKSISNIDSMRLVGIVLSLIMCIVLIFASHVYAYIFTDDTSTTDKGHFQVEYWADYYKDTQYNYDSDYKSRIRKTKLSLYMLYGLADNWDIGVTVPYGYINYDRETKANGFMDIDIETKYRLLEETNLRPSIAFYIDYSTGSGNEDKSLGNAGEDLWLNCIFSKTIKRNLWLDLNLGYYFTGGKASDDVFIYALGLTRGFRDKLYVYAELYGETEFEVNFNNNVCLGALGIGYEINPNFFVKLATAAGISDGANDLRISSRICLSF